MGVGCVKVALFYSLLVMLSTVIIHHDVHAKGAKTSSVTQAPAEVAKMPQEKPAAKPLDDRVLTVPQKQGVALVVPFNTVLPTQGDRAISGNKMLAAMGSYLRGYRHYLYQPDQRPFVFKQEGNCELSGQGSEEKIAKLMTKSPLFLGFIGTELFLSLQPKLQNNELMLLFPLEGLEDLRTPQYPNVIYFRPSHTKELEALTSYAIKKCHKTSFGLLYEESSWGEKLLTTAKKILDKYPDVKLVAEASYPQGTVEIEKALDQIAPEAPNVVLCLARARPAYTFIRHALNKKLHETLFLGMSELNAIQGILRTALGMNIVVTSVVPSPEQHADLPIIKEYKKVMDSFLSSRVDSPIYLETFINLLLTEQSFKELIQQGKKLTPHAIVNHLEAVNQVNFHGITLHFNTSDRSLSSMLWINPGIGQKWLSFDEVA